MAETNAINQSQSNYHDQKF